ncbi:MAG: hypothetical protein PQJ59_18555, partial [Spirochaetales bacterium]|nr:hypothetical protein [Spirochaetales bacterium]
FTWDDPADADFATVEITWEPDGETAVSLDKGTGTYTVTGLDNSEEYLFSFVSLDIYDNRSEALSISCQPDGDGPVSYSLLYSAEDLYNIRDDLSASYYLMNDIDLSEYSSWTPIGDYSNSFTGNVDGCDYKITNLVIDNSDSYQGLFGLVEGDATISNLTIEDCSITSSNSYVGGMMGKYVGTSDTTDGAGIYNCTVSGTVSGSMYVGGICGNMRNEDGSSSITVSNCHADVDVTATSYFSGGFCGLITTSFDIDSCSSSGSVTGTNYSGGFTSSITTCTIENSFSTSDVSGKTQVGGFLGKISDTNPNNCYSTGDVTNTDVDTTTDIGGFIGFIVDDEETSNCFYSGTLANGMEDNGLGTRKTEEEMQVESTFTGYDFTTIWGLDSDINDGFPYLRARYE